MKLDFLVVEEPPVHVIIGCPAMAKMQTWINLQSNSVQVYYREDIAELRPSNEEPIFFSSSGDENSERFTPNINSNYGISTDELLATGVKKNQELPSEKRNPSFYRTGIVHAT